MYRNLSFYRKWAECSQLVFFSDLQYHNDLETNHLPNMHLQTKLKYAALFALSFAVLTGLAFLAGLFLNIEFAPSPVAMALFDLAGFAPIMTVGALILGFAEAFLGLWLYHSRRNWFWPVVLILSIIFGGLASFFSLWIVWVFVAIACLLLNLIMVRFIELREFKTQTSR